MEKDPTDDLTFRDGTAACINALPFQEITTILTISTTLYNSTWLELQQQLPKLAQGRLPRKAQAVSQSQQPPQAEHQLLRPQPLRNLTQPRTRKCQQKPQPARSNPRRLEQRRHRTHHSQGRGVGIPKPNSSACLDRTSRALQGGSANVDTRPTGSSPDIDTAFVASWRNRRGITRSDGRVQIPMATSGLTLGYPRLTPTRRLWMIGNAE